MATPIRRRTLNIRFLTVFLVAVVFLGAGTHFLHAYQIRRNANALLEAADKAEADKDMPKFAEYLGKYVGFRPKDLDARARYALLLDSQSKNVNDRYRAYLLLEAVLRDDPISDRPAVRRRAAEMAISMNRSADARAHIERLLQSQPDDGELEDLLGRCEEASKQFAKARTAYEASLKHSPGRVATTYALARLLRGHLNPAPELDKAADADRVMDALVAASPDSFDARMMRCRYYQAAGNLDAAERDLAYLREKVAPKNADVLIASAQLAEARHRADEARKHWQLGCQLYPDDARFSTSLARLELWSGGEHRAAAAQQLRAALKEAKDDPETLWELADLFIDAGEKEDAQKVIERLPATGIDQIAIDFLKARLLAVEGRTGEAVDQMERCRAASASRSGLAFLSRKMNLLLGTWYDQLGNPDQQLASYERVLTEDALSTRARAGKAMALAKLGRIDDALALLRTLIGDTPSLRLNAARLMLSRDMRLPPEQRNWAEAERMLQDAPGDVKNSPDYHLMLIDLYAGSNRWEMAEAAARKACDDNPKETRFWLALSALYDRAPKPDPERARAVLDEAQRQAGDSADLRVAKGVRATERPPAEARPLLKKLEEKLDAFSPGDQARIATGLAAAYNRIGDSKEALRLLGLAVARRPADLGIRQQYFDTAVLAGDDAAAARQIEDLHRIEGDEGVLWRYEDAARLVHEGRKGNADALSAARKQLAEIASRRPNWARRLVLEGEIAELEGRSELALENYQRAIDRGERSKRVVRRAVQFLANRRRTDDARQLLQKVIEQAPVGAGDLNRMLVEVSLPDTDNKQQSLEMVRAAVSPESKEYRDFLWQGQVLASLGEKKEAETAIRKALGMRPNSPECWTALIVLLAETGRKDEARVELDRSQTTLPEPLRPVVLGPCREALGDTSAAEAVYTNALKRRPNDPAAKRGVASFYLRTGAAAKAEPILRSLAAGDGPDACWGRRTLAMGMAVSGDYQRTREALELLDKNLKSVWTSPEDSRARAMVLALRPGDRRTSIAALEESFVRVKPTPSEEFLLAQLYDADRNWTKANERLLSLVNSKHGATPLIIAYYVKGLLRHNQASDARFWLNKLEQLDPESARTAELKARMLKEEGKGDEAARVLSEFARKDFAAKGQPEVLVRTADLLADLGRPAEADALYRMAVDRSEKTKPECLLALASFLARQGRVRDALDMCDRAATRCPPEVVAGVYVGALRLSQPTDAERKRVRDWLETAIKNKPDSVGLLVARADMLDAFGDYEASEKVYRQLLERDKNNILALNNLAWLLAVRENKGEEAQGMINRAIELAGPVGDLLDTRASVLLVLDRPDDAVKCLEDAVQQLPNGQRYFHLTQAFEKAGKREAARDAWIKATKEMLLNEKTLHPLERADFSRFQSELSSGKS
jgi:tetratricopeptide (TPR) repeat protein